MLKLFSRSALIANALLLAAGISSALGAPNLHHGTNRAGHRRATHHHTRRRHHRGHNSRRGPNNTSAIVRAAATTTSVALLGDEAVESLRDNLSTGQAEAFPFQARAAGTAGTAHVYIDSGNAATTLFVGLYTNAGSQPGSLLGTGSIPSPHAGGWNTVTVAPTQLVSGGTYWLAVLGTGGTLRYRDRAHGPCKALTSAQTNLRALSSTWSTATAYATCPISAYLTAATSTFPVEPPGPVELTPPVESSPPVESPPPPAAPTNSSLPTIGGTATLGQTLSATTGAWTGSPSTYAYQWQDCDSAGANCANVSSATSATYKLGSGDVGHTVRVVVSASNSAGQTPATSTSVGPVNAPPPTASFVSSPTTPTIGQQGTLNATSSTCPDVPCTYAWSDDGSPTRPLPALWPLGSGQTLPYTFSSTGTKYVRLVVTDAAGQEATVEHNIVVEENPPPPPPPAAPTNSSLPTIGGTATLGQTLSATTGAWTGSPST
ncbi:MAG TPA: hypothetical protein VNY52_04930, partial [Solirubrobacteraceae bacterium]|nr:hypothetical protein [Solirubrobacteraceae bacterium]